MEKVNHPKHYNILGKKECIEQMRDDYGETITSIFCLTSCYKYLYRAGVKPGESQKDDIDKAKWYFNYFKTIAEYTIFDSKLERLYDYIKKEMERWEQN